MGSVCLSPHDPDNHWDKYCPSWPAAVTFCVLFGITLVLHIVQAWQYKKGFMWVLVMGAVWEFIAATTRIVSMQDPHNKNTYEVSFVFLVLAPLWINAFDYVLLGRMIWYFLPEKKLAGIPSTRLAIYFVTMDITSFIIQLAGALMTTGNTVQSDINGLHVYTAGVALQQAVILGFTLLGIAFFVRLRSLKTEQNKRAGLVLMGVLYTSLALITWRIIFRIIEFSAGLHSALNNTLDDNEWFVYVFDIGPMFLALATYHFYHPGMVLQGPEAEFPKLSKEEKALKKCNEREEKRRLKTTMISNSGHLLTENIEMDTPGGGVSGSGL